MSRPMLGACALLFVVLTLCTYARAQVWMTPESLWADAASKAPLKPRPWINLGLALELRGEIEAGLKAHQQALALSFQPRLTFYQQKFSRVASETNIARVLAQTGREQAALSMLNDIIGRHPNFPWARFNRGILLARMGHCQEGLPDLKIAETLDPDLANPGCPPL